MSKTKYELNERIHAIIINPYLTWDEFSLNCDLIKKYNIKNVSTSLNYINYLKQALENYRVKINALISFPFADLPFSLTNEIILYAKDKGANGIEYTPKFINLSKQDLDTFASEIEMINSHKLPVTIIINKQKLEKEIFIKALKIFLELGITNFQFGDGFGPSISSLDLDEILKLIDNQNTIKVVGGIKKLSQVIDLFDLGIGCVGTSNFYAIFEEVKIN